MKGVLTVGPLFLGLVALTTTLVLLTSTIGVDAKWPPWVVLFALGGVLATTGGIAARYWHRSRWRAYGALAVAFAFVAVVTVMALLLFLLIEAVSGATS